MVPLPLKPAALRPVQGDGLWQLSAEWQRTSASLKAIPYPYPLCVEPLHFCTGVRDRGLTSSEPPRADSLRTAGTCHWPSVACRARPTGRATWRTENTHREKREVFEPDNFPEATLRAPEGRNATWSRELLLGSGLCQYSGNASGWQPRLLCPSDLRKAAVPGGSLRCWRCHCNQQCTTATQNVALSRSI
ncbi:hypothetical protein HaLaN_08202 [Haematococcus lacustris]|uniref:Uncharacterized protein n=1 Tax=Haematococcus lacustris TaxID=44745 RepID=A0A699YYI5_HAELA|nr:hypothetical protein HaLaN_08202 [Haematococcus lacustris]